MRSFFSSALFAALLCPLATAPALAHAVIVTAAPGVDEVVHGPSVPIELHFNSRIDRERSRLSLIAPDGSTVPLPLREGGAETLAATASGVTAGHYRLHWQVLGIDGHISRGDIPFQVAP